MMQRTILLSVAALLLLAGRPAAANITVTVGTGVPHGSGTTSGDPVASASGIGAQVASNGGGTTTPFIAGGDIAVAYCQHWEPVGIPSSSAQTATAKCGYGGLVVYNVPSNPAPAAGITMSWIEGIAAGAGVVADPNATVSARVGTLSSGSVGNNYVDIAVPNDGTTTTNVTPYTSYSHPNASDGTSAPYYGPDNTTYPPPSSPVLYYSTSGSEMGIQTKSGKNNDTGLGWASGAYLHTWTGQEHRTYYGIRSGGNYIAHSFGDVPSYGNSNDGAGAQVSGSSATGLWHAASAVYMRQTVIQIQ